MSDYFFENDLIASFVKTSINSILTICLDTLASHVPKKCVTDLDACKQGRFLFQEVILVQILFCAFTIDGKFPWGSNICS